MATKKRKLKAAVPSRAAHDYAAQPWLVKPTRVGWWWFAARDGTTRLLWLISREEYGHGAMFAYWIDPVNRFVTTNLNTRSLDGWWSGPVESPEPPRAETRPNK